MEGSPLPKEPKVFVLGTYGSRENFFTLKGEVEALLQALHTKKPEYRAVTDNPSYHPGRCAAVVMDGRQVGVFGQVHPLVAKNYGIDGEVYTAELAFTELMEHLAEEATYRPLPKFPPVSRDLALVGEESTTVGELEDCIRRAGGKLLKRISLFDIYRGAGVAPGKKSVAFSLELRSDEHTLSDADIDPVIQKILAALEQELHAVLR